jgi:Lrp/AsnC family transcriptional regulator for asnA, asnC and gidA
VQAMLGVNVQGDLDDVFEHLRSMGEVVYLVATAGRFDVLVEVVCEDADRFLDLIGRVRRLEGVQSAEIFTYLRLEKQVFDWGVR